MQNVDLGQTKVIQIHQSSAEVEQWVLLSAQHVELEPGQALVVKSMTWIRKQNFPAPHVTRIVALSPNEYFSTKKKMRLY